MKDKELRKSLEKLDIIFKADYPDSDWRSERFKEINRKIEETDDKVHALLSHLGLLCNLRPQPTIIKISKEAKCKATIC